MENKIEKKSFITQVVSRPKWAAVLLISLILLGIILVHTFMLGANLYNTFKSRQQELQFTWDHPAIIKITREDYASKSAQLDQSYLNKTPTPQDQLLQEVANQLKTSK